MIRYVRKRIPRMALRGVTWISLLACGSGRAAVTSSDTTNPTYFLGRVGIGTNSPTVTLDVVGGLRAGSSAAVTSCSGGTEGSQRYNYSSHAMEFCNGSAWMQLPVQVPGATTTVTAIGPSVGANVYTFSSASANYSPAYGSLGLTYDNIWMGPQNSYQNSNCVQAPVATNNAIVYDLGSTKTIGNVYIAGGSSHTNAFAAIVAFSLDNVTYASAVMPASGYDQCEYASLAVSPTVTARYVRVTNIQSPSGDPNNATLCDIAVGP